MMDNPFDIPATSATPQQATATADSILATPSDPGNPFGGGTTPEVSASDFGFGVPSNSQPMASPFGGDTGGSMPQFGGGNNNNQKKKYKFIQLYWLINSKLAAGQAVNNESHLMEINYNADYSNLRLTFANAKQDTFITNTNAITAIKIQNSDRQTTINIYPETAEHLLFNIQQKIAGKIPVYERVIGSGNWNPNQTVFNINLNPFEVGVYSKTSNGQTYAFIFSGWQVMALIKALKFLTEGPAYTIDIAKFLSNE